MPKKIKSSINTRAERASVRLIQCLRIRRSKMPVFISRSRTVFVGAGLVVTQYFGPRGSDGNGR